MQTRSGSRSVSAGTSSSENHPLPLNSGREMSDITQGAQDDASNTVTRLSSPAARMPSPHPTHDQSASMAPAPVSLDFLAQSYRTGEYSDLEIVSNGVERSVHKVIVCSQSPVIKRKCSLRWSHRVELNEYDPETLSRVLDFCYRRTYSDGEFPETAASFLDRMTVDDVQKALEAPLAILSNSEDPEWSAECLWCGDSDSEDGGGACEGGDSDGGDSDGGEYLPCTCDIHNPLNFNMDIPCVYGKPLFDVPLGPSQPPYEISLFANFKVYIAAKDLQIPSLQLLARERFAHSLRSHWSRFAELPLLIEQIYMQTDRNDPLRTLICRIVAADYDIEYEMAFKTEIRELMTRNGEFATEVLETGLRMKKEWADME